MQNDTYALRTIADAICRSRCFSLKGTAGSGSYKETYLAEDEDKRLVAVKVLKPGCCNERTTREIDAMRRCATADFVPLLEISDIVVGSTRYEYLIEEFMGGGTLQERLSTAPLSRENTITLGTSLTRALIVTSAEGLVHRDFKPANIMFRDAGFAGLLSDFGIVRDLGKNSLTQSYLAMGPGSPFFAAPEQLNNQKLLIDWRTDQFSLGVTLSISLFGLHPYAPNPEAQPVSVIQLVSQRKGPAEWFSKACLSKKLSALPKMLQAWPIARFHSAEQLNQVWIGQDTNA